MASASGLEDGQLHKPSDIQETTEKDEDGASANEPISGEGEIHGDSDSYEEKEDHRVDKLQNEQSKDAALESQNEVKQSSERQQRQSISEENKDNQDVTSKKMEDKNVAATEDRDPPGVHLIKFQENNNDDDVNPRSKISTRPKENPSTNYKPLSENKVQSNDISEKQDEDVSASGSMLNESGEGEGDESKFAKTKASDKSSETKITSGESEEMKDIAGEIKTGSKIFEADISDPESVSGCSSGFGCFSGNGEQSLSEKSEEAVELETRSKIATAPQVTDAKSQQTESDQNIETAHRQTSPVRDVASGSDKAVKDDIQNNGEDEAPESDDISGAKSVANSNTKAATTALETSQESLKAAKSDDVDEKISTEKASSGSGADVNDDIQGQSVHGDNDESIDSGKPATNSNALSGSGSGTDTTQLKSESPKEVQNAATSEAESKKVNEQEDTQKTTAKTEPVDEDKSDAKNANMNGQNKNMKNVVAQSMSHQNKSATKTDADNKEMSAEKEDMTDNEKSKSTYESETKSDKGNEEEKQQQEDTETIKSESTNEDHSTAKGDVDSKVEDGQKDVKDTTVTKTDESQKSDAENKDMHGQDDTKTDTTESKPIDNQSGAKSDKENEELDGQKDVKAVGTNDSQSGAEMEEDEENDSSSGSATAPIDTNQSTDANEDEEPGIAPTTSKTKSKTANTQHADTEENDMEDALHNNEDMLNENKGSGAGSGQPQKDNNEDLSSPAARQRITSMEQLIKDDKPKAEKIKDVPAKTRENVPEAEETPDDYINTDIGKNEIKLFFHIIHLYFQ